MGLFNSSRSNTSQFVQTTSTQQNTGGGAEGSVVAGAGATINNPNPERLLQPIFSYLSDAQRQATEYNRAALELNTQARAAESTRAAQVLERNASLTADTVTKLAEQRASETGALEALAVKFGPWVIGAVVVLGLFGRRRA